mgnify:FL=1
MRCSSCILHTNTTQDTLTFLCHCYICIISGIGHRDPELAERSLQEERSVTQQRIVVKQISDGKPPLFVKRPMYDGFLEYNIEEFSINGLRLGTHVVVKEEGGAHLSGTVQKMGRRPEKGKISREDIQVFIKLVRNRFIYFA